MGYSRAKRYVDLGLSIPIMLLVALPVILIGILVVMTSRGPIIHWSDRVGKDNILFKMPKFRTMVVETPKLATHLLDEPEVWLTPVGPFLRKFSLDELPQLWSVIRGEMSLVGPRPALYNQTDLIELRTSLGVHRITPGVTGWAQISGRDELDIRAKVVLDTEYLLRRSLRMDFLIILKTFSKVLCSKDVSH